MSVSMSKKFYTPALRDQMQPGDIIAFGGKTQFSRVIKWFTGISGQSCCHSVKNSTARGQVQGVLQSNY